MAKRLHIDRPVEKRVSIPQSVVTRVDAILADPLSDKPTHGAWAKLVTGLLQQWLATQPLAGPGGVAPGQHTGAGNP